MKNNIEKVINYLLSCNFNNIKLTYIIKDKQTDTIYSSKIKCNFLKENGYSIDFSYGNNNYFIASSNSLNLKDIKKYIKQIVKTKIIIKNKNSFVFNDDFINIDNNNKLDENNISNIINEFSKKDGSLKIRIPILYEKKYTYIIKPFEKNISKVESNYKLDIIMSCFANNKNRFNYYSKGCSNNIDLLKEVDINKELNSLYNTLLKMQSIENSNERVDIITSNGIGGLLFHESLGHSLEEREINKRTSVLNDIKIISNKRISLVDNPLIDNSFGFYKIDDEGNNSKENTLIKQGNIINYITCGSSSRRESYYHNFSSRMSNTYIENGENNIDKIISSVKNGYYIKNIVGGVSNTLSGDISFNCIESYKITNGIVDYSVCYDNLVIVGNTIDILNSVDMVGNDLKLSPGICGSESGFIYTEVGQPTIKIKDVLVVS